MVSEKAIPILSLIKPIAVDSIADKHESTVSYVSMSPFSS